jgi:hypothetical protein
VERSDEGFSIVFQPEAVGVRPPDRLVVHVGDVHDVRDFEALVFQEPLEQVLEHVGPVVADVGVVVDRRAAGVELDLSGDERDEVLLGSGEGVGETDHGAVYYSVPRTQRE